MPIEVTLLALEPPPLEQCPRCHIRPFVPFLRGHFQRSKRSWWGWGKPQPYCAIICAECKAIVGYEEPLLVANQE